MMKKKFDKAMKSYTDKLNEYPIFAADTEDKMFELCNNAETFAQLNQDFNVSSIAAGESDFDKTLALMAYVHQELFYIGDNISPPDNTYDIMKVRKTGALFCNYHATVLSEMLLSIGIQAIKIACIPKDFDGERHVAVLAYMKELCQWVYFDPTFDTYFFDEANRPLGIFEIRKRYQSSERILFKPIEIDKQWPLVMNGLVCKTYDKWYYLYMAKNCFRFALPQRTSIQPVGCKIKNEYDEVSYAL